MSTIQHLYVKSFRHCRLLGQPLRPILGQLCIVRRRNISTVDRSCLRKTTLPSYKNPDGRFEININSHPSYQISQTTIFVNFNARITKYLQSFQMTILVVCFQKLPEKKEKRYSVPTIFGPKLNKIIKTGKTYPIAYSSLQSKL